MFLKQCGQFFLGCKSKRLFLHLSTFEDKNRRDTVNVIFLRQIRFIVNIDLTDFILAVALFSQLFHYRSEHLTRSAPFSPEINKYRNIGLQDLGFKVFLS